jgi:hypothetical protein
MIVETEKFQTLKAAVIDVFDKLPENLEFHGNELHNWVWSVYPKARHVYVDSILKCLRKHRRPSFVCVDIQSSKYRKIKPIEGFFHGYDLRRLLK